MQEAVKNYRPPEIISAVKEIATETLNLGECVKELRQKEVTNIKYKVRGPLDTHLVGDPKRELDIREAISFLKNRGYLVERYEIPDLSTYGFVFMHPNHLEQHGWLSLIDSTHKTNRYDCRLFTLYIRNSYGCWDVGAHFFVTSTNALESYHSELKMTTSPKHGLIGACNNIVVLDDKKQIDSECVTYEFRTKKISFIGVDDEILTEIHKFPFPVQQMIIKEYCAVDGRLEKGKTAPGLTSLNCYCRMFDETGFDVYMHREIDLNVPVSRLTEAENAIVNRRQSVSELMERICDTYWRVKERGNAEQTGVFIEELKGCLEPILNNK
ncbi:unnamed protein product [Rhizophagus irregularis]|nr:unnamed protein product [Rhizophagus irregularis]